MGLCGAAVHGRSALARRQPRARDIKRIEEMLYKGINITWLFSVRAYEAVAHAYIRAMERRVAESQPVDHVASVASFFLCSPRLP
jgi:hypothetical protein